MKTKLEIIWMVLTTVAGMFLLSLLTGCAVSSEEKRCAAYFQSRQLPVNNKCK